MSDNPLAMADFPILEIAAFVDSTTAIVVGHRVAMLKEGDELYVLGIGEIDIPKAGVPLVVPKASLEVTASAGVYAVTRSPAEQTLVPSPLATYAELFERMQTISRRNPLIKDDIQFLGNPAKAPVKIGDVVVLKDDLSKYVVWLSKTNAAKSKP